MKLSERMEISRMWWESMPVLMGWLVYRPAADKTNAHVFRSDVPSFAPKYDKPKREGEAKVEIEDPLTSASLVEAAIEGMCSPPDALAVKSHLKACLSDPRKPLIEADEKIVEMRNRVITEVYRQIEVFRGI